MVFDSQTAIGRSMASIQDLREAIFGLHTIEKDIEEEILLLHTQLEVQKRFEDTANILRKAPEKNKNLPDQRHRRVLSLIEYVFKRYEHKSKLKEETKSKHEKLRGMDCDTLKLCGLSYTVTEVMSFSKQHIDIISSSFTTRFIESRSISSLLYHPSINKVLENVPKKVEDMSLYGNFLKEHYNRRLNIATSTTNTIPISREEEGEPTTMHAAERAQMQKRKHDGITSEEARLPKKTATEKAVELRSERFLGDVWKMKSEDLKSLDWNHIHDSAFLTVTDLDYVAPQLLYPCCLTIWISRECATNWARDGEFVGAKPTMI
ncbi:hypothetical protein ACMFMG_011976 [Clarireedia jacksonii]